MHNLITGNYRVAPIATRAVVLIAGLWCLLSVMGCTGFAEQSRADGPEEGGDGHEVASDLYRSMVVVFREETEGLDVESPDHFLVISEFEAVQTDRRRRYVGQIVPVGSGIGVQVTIEYQRATQEGSKSDLEWRDEPRESFREEVEPEELRLARRVERVYHRGDY